MKNAIRILLYLLLALLVVAITVIIYKRSKTPTDDLPTTSEMADSLFMDQNQGNQTALNSEDSMILDLTGQLPSQVGAPASSENKISDAKSVESKPAESKTPDAKQTLTNAKPATTNTSIDYSQPIGPTEPSAAVNTNPKAQKVSDHSTKAKPEATVLKPAVLNKSETKKSESASKTTAKSTASKAGSAKSTSNKAATKTTASSTGNSGTFYVVSGSFIVPGHADEQVKKLKKLGYKHASRKVFGSSEYYCAVAGNFTSRKEAEQVVSKLKAKGEKAFLKTK
jgi:outer membrane biosynthesis protein TonB